MKKSLPLGSVIIIFVGAMCFKGIFFVEAGIEAYIIDTEWNYAIGGDDYDEAKDIIQTTDGGFALAGSTYSYAINNSNF